MTFQISKFGSNQANGLKPLALIAKNSVSSPTAIIAISNLSKAIVFKPGIVSGVSRTIISSQKLPVYLSARVLITKNSQTIFKSYFGQGGVVYSLTKFSIALAKSYYPKGVVTPLKTIAVCKPLIPKGFVILTASKRGLVKFDRPTKGQIFPRRRY